MLYKGEMACEHCYYLGSDKKCDYYFHYDPSGESAPVNFIADYGKGYYSGAAAAMGSLVSKENSPLKKAIKLAIKRGWYNYRTLQFEIPEAEFLLNEYLHHLQPHLTKKYLKLNKEE